MKRKIAAAAAIATATVLSAAACSSSGTSTTGAQGTLSTDGKGKTITVWLQQDAEKGWMDVVKSAEDQFTKETGAKVSIQWQTWPNYSVKLDTALLSGNAPDAVEFGNTQTAKYIAAGALVDLTGVKSKFSNSGSWLDSLAASGQSPQGKTYAVPYYAGVRTLIYRKDIFAAAGVTTPPTTFAELKADLDKVKAKNAGKSGFSTLYLPGKDWYVATAFGADTYGTDGVIANQTNGSWAGTLTEPNFIKGVKTWQQFQQDYSVGGTTVDESNQDQLMAKGNIAAIVGLGYEASTVSSNAPGAGGNPALADKLATVALPSASGNGTMPQMLGGSDMAVPSKAKNPGLGAEFVRIFTDTQRQTMLAKYAIPNNKTLMSKYESVSPGNQASGQAASGKTWFIPNSQFWSQASDETALQNAYSAIAGGADPQKSLATAQTTILGDLNGS
ncbi:extracellular solute-binding protein [Phaeacidiphilus oryzae]|uniref:extracellular solute-binding protein n=1 Tax=Phaeacidiphilus oryzae TaxID=348818 RepID=UPI00056C5159|nr:extracellular solute-binding protein [Phaeacidiphilus oryzae]